LCALVSLPLGVLIAVIYGYQGTCSKNFMVTLVMLPVLVQMIIMLVNGNLGTSVAVLGAFSLVRFRSVPGSSKEMAVIFFAMAAGLATGTGYLGFAAVMTVMIGLVFLILERTHFGETKREQKDLRITIAEHLDYTEIFDDIFRKYTNNCRLQRVKTTNLGSMYELEYYITLKDIRQEKEMIDAIRCRNGNLTIICGRRASIQEEL
jgi:type IV secretory pathway VirB2 component (pilin)